MSVPSLAPAGHGTKVQEILQVGEDGDTILVVGPDKAKIQVLSSFLKHISPVFRAMLNSSMSEGEALRNRVFRPETQQVPSLRQTLLSGITLKFFGHGLLFFRACPTMSSRVWREASGKGTWTMRCFEATLIEGLELR
ncbi:hypothetical protein DER45DRAFT_619704 [Fusarium avenaceum]|nr:hypothetical protein DER45DRAFT_619704 [Fusarium avenaceum]